ncbi:reticulon-3 isoform X4 [Phyllopteryx taeniolatus]|uniref:reticulon-3 isoform X4 n=1 Tax=Phyllopteryx taeniolatus TaxID=161469 RepID=UPI002AD465AA|nr:reticulon-3 isoform X4 [Phyllopteryx taeniolatus]
MEPMTQSAQISSSQGLADGQNSASKEPRPSDSFLSSSPVSLIQSSQEKKAVLGSSRPGDEGVATSLRFSSQPGSFSPDNYGGEAQPDSPVKMSPVSERIKALEALAGKKQADFRSDCCSHLKDRHHDKSPKQCMEKNKPAFHTKTGSPDLDSPESPFEVLGEFRQMNEFEETEAWMKAHLPPVPDLHAAGFVKGADSFQCKPTEENAALPALAGVRNDASKVKAPQKEGSVEEADFDLNFLPTAYMWTRQDNSGVRAPSRLDSEHEALPQPLSGFESPSPPNDDTLDAPDDERTAWTGDLESAEAKEVDSSGESEETVIEDGFTAVGPSPKSDWPPSSDITTSPATSTPDAERVTPPVRSERKLMQVPTINVIETDEPNCSDDEMEMEFEEEDDEVVNEGAKPAETPPEDSNEASKRRPVETEFMEGYSPPSSPVESDEEYAPQDTILNPQADAFLEKSSELNDSGLDLSPDANKDISSPGNEDEWSDEARQTVAGQDRADFSAPDNDKDVVAFSRNSIMRGDTYEGQSFEYEQPSPFCEIEVTPKGAKDHFLLDSSEVDTETQEPLPNRNDANASASHRFPPNPSDISDAMASENGSASERVDSFVEFMRECLKSREGEGPEASPSDEYGPQSPPTVLMDPERERLTISALKQLGGSQEADEETLAPPSKTPQNANAACIQRASFTPPTSAPCSQSDVLGTERTYSEDVDAVDIWVAEAYHLAQHVLTAILTHVSVKDLLHWRDPKKSGVVFGVSMLLLLSLAAFSVISVVSYLLLALLCVTITFRIYKSVVQAVQKSSDGHPFKSLIEKDVSIPPENFRKHVDTSLTYINRALKYMSRLFLVEDLVDSLKLAVVMWLLTYVGAVFNGITILILADILLFAVPPVYEKNKTQIDQYVDLARSQINTTIAKLQEKLPGAVKRSKAE